MATVGFDIGNKSSVVAAAQRGGIDVLMNEVSSRQTPTVVGFGEKSRFIGDAAVAQQISNLKNTVGGLKRLLGRNWSDPKFQAELPLWVGPQLVQLPNDKVGVEVMYKYNKITLTPEQLMAMVIQQLKTVVERDAKAKVVEAVVSVPPYFNDIQRRAMIDSCKIANLPLLRVVNDTTAIAINYGLYKPNLPEGEAAPLKVMFLDMGESHFSAAVVHFWNDRMKVVASASDETLSGREFDVALGKHFAAEFLEKKKVDLQQHPKSWLRLLTQCARIKVMLNTNPSAAMNVECIYNELDLSSVVTRDKYNELIQPVCDRAIPTIKAVLTQANVQASELSAVEAVGSGMRTTLLVQTIATQLGITQVSTTMNAEEAVAKGCALQAAMLSSKFKVKEYNVTDILTHPVTIYWHGLNESDTTEHHVELFKPHSALPAPKYVTFNRPECKPLEVLAKYSSPESAHDQLIATVQIKNIPKPKVDVEKPEVRFKIKIGIDGTLHAEAAELVDRFEEDEAVAPAATPAAAPAPAADATPAAATNGDAMDVEKDEKKPETKKKKVVRYVPATCEVTYHGVLTDAQIKDFIKAEDAFVADVVAAVAVADAKNAVEAYCYNSRAKLDDQWKDYASEKEKATLNALIEKMEEWLYDEGADETKEVYEKKLLELKVLGEPIQIRHSEEEARVKAVADFGKTMEYYYLAATDGRDIYEHIEAKEKEKITLEIGKARSWLDDMTHKQNKLAKSQDPVLFSRDITVKAEEVKRAADIILAKPKPKPAPAPAPAPKPAEQPAPEKPAEGAQPAPQAAPNGTEADKMDTTQ